jgi:imidazole glycerol-phosphate synthase subunit HisH
MEKKVTIIDYGMSNLLSIQRAFEHIGASVKVTSTIDDINDAEYLVLPGVGAFPDGMRELGKRGMIGPIKQYAASGKPLLGVCLGMQMLLSRGYEHHETEGLNIIEGEVLPLPKDMKGFKVPNINWHSVAEHHAGAWQNSIFGNTENEACFYFVHSYHAQPKNENDLLAVSNFGSFSYAASIKHGNVTGTQFHPEKSGEEGLQLLRKFIEI